MLAGAVALVTSGSANAAVLGTLGFENYTDGTQTSSAIGGELGFSSVSVGTPTNTASQNIIPQVTSQTASAAGNTAAIGTATNANSVLNPAGVNKTGAKYWVTSNAQSSTNTATRNDVLTVDAVSIAGFTSRTVSFKMFLGNTTYETTADNQAQDFIKARLVFSNGSPDQTLIDTTTLAGTGDIDNLPTTASSTLPVKGQFNTLTFAIPDNIADNTAQLIISVAGNSGTGAEAYAVDAVSFDGQPNTPEPGTLGLAGVVGMGILARRRRKAQA